MNLPLSWFSCGALFSLLFSAAAAARDCTSHTATASTAGLNWGNVTNTPGTSSDGVNFRSRSNDPSDGRATSIADASATVCDINLGLEIPSVPGRTPRSFSWGEAAASATLVSPRAGLLILDAGISEALLQGEHDGNVGPQVTLLVDGAEVSADEIRQATAANESVREIRVGAGLHSLELRARNVRVPENPNNFPFTPDLFASANFRIFLDPLSVGTVKDVDRFGDPATGLAGVQVELLANENVVATATTASDGGFNFPGVDGATLHDLRLERDNLVRTYRDITVDSLLSVPLALPVTLRQRLDAELAKLENTPTLVSAYDTAAVRRLTQDWNVAQPELAQVHADRDHALARLQVAGEGMAGLLGETVPLATDTAKVTVDTITTMLSARKVVDELATQIAQRGGALAGAAATTVAQRQLQLALEFLVTALSGASDKLQELAVDAVKSVLPEWAADLFEQGLKLIAGTVLEAFSSGSWSSSDARAGLLETITTELAGQVGGRVLATGYVLQTNEDLLIAGIKARRFDGNGTVLDAFQTVQARNTALALSHQQLIALNATLGDTAKGWSTVADLSLLIGRRPGAQLIASLGAVIKGVSAGALAGLSVANYLALYDTAFEQSPGVVRDAFGPSALKASRRPPQRFESMQRKSLPPDFADRLAALRNALQTAVDATAVERGEELLEAGAAFDAALELERLRLAALVTDDGPAALPQALAQLAGAAGVLAGESITLYAHLGGLFAPDFADPSLDPAAIPAQFDAVSAALAAVDTALAQAQTEATGLTVPAVVFVTGHGLAHRTAKVSVGRGQFELRGVLVNAGGESAQAVQATLEITIEGDASRLVLLDPAAQSVGDLSPGERREVTWSADFRPSGSAPQVQQVGYRIVTLPAAGRGKSVSGTFALEPEKNQVFDSGFE